MKGCELSRKYTKLTEKRIKDKKSIIKRKEKRKQKRQNEKKDYNKNMVNDCSQKNNLDGEIRK